MLIKLLILGPKNTRSLEEGGMENNIGTVSHEFFHAWNVERIRPNSLEPFDFETIYLFGQIAAGNQ